MALRNVIQNSVIQSEVPGSSWLSNFMMDNGENIERVDGSDQGAWSCWMRAGMPPLPGRRGGTQIVRTLKQLVIALFFAVVGLVVSSSMRASNAASPALKSKGPEARSGSQPRTKFDHGKHSQLKCDQCHVRKVDALVPVMPGHSACISCHIKQFTTTQFAICSNCHEGITAVRPPVLGFPERQSFGVEFSHKTHATYVSGEKRAECSSCHSVAGARTTFPAHRECYVCHKASGQVNPGEKVGGASCGECHTASGDKKSPSLMSRAYNYRFTHQVHAQREGIVCTECHSVLGGAAANQVSVAQLREHRGAGFQSCGGCHNGRRAFSGELVGNACARCHGRNMM